jgi:hypothetical protein
VSEVEGDRSPVVGPAREPSLPLEYEGLEGYTGGGGLLNGTPGSPGEPGAMGGGGRYRVDLDRAPQAIADLREAARLLREESREAERLARVTPPGLDAVSTDAARVIGEAAAGPEGSLRAALLGGAEELDRQAGELEADLTAYRQVEAINVPQARALEL